jgi:Smg protein
MFDVLVYLFHNYYTPQACPTADVLAKRLAAAGFEHEEIDEALRWLLGLAEATEDCVDLAQNAGDGFRVYASAETEKLSPEAIGFITFLENTDVLAPPLREIVIDRAMACDDGSVNLARIKVISLMVLWSQEAEIDHLILEELLRLHDGDDVCH